MFDLTEILLFDKPMRWVNCSLIFLISFSGYIFGQGMHLVVTQIGDGALLNNADEESKPISPASFIPQNSEINILSNSGIETMSSGYQFRFGSDTKFFISPDFIHLHTGSIMVQSRKIGNKISLRSSETLVEISGVGTCMLEVEANGGFKIVGVLGRLQLTGKDNLFQTDLLAGELITITPGSTGLVDKINVNLAKVVETSFLLSGFKNHTSFKSSLDSIVQAQKESVTKILQSQSVGTNKVDSFTDSPKGNNNEISIAVDEGNTFFINRTSYQVPSLDPLEELLGRSPKRVSPSNKGTEPGPSKTRSLPGTLLRLKN